MTTYVHVHTGQERSAPAGTLHYPWVDRDGEWYAAHRPTRTRVERAKDAAQEEVAKRTHHGKAKDAGDA